MRLDAPALFETIHPYLDGSGRVGRLLITFLPTEKGLLAQPVLYLSHFLERFRSEYYDHLQGIREAGDREGWLAFFLRGVSEVSREAAATAAGILQMRKDYRTRITEGLGRAAANGHRIMEQPFDHPIVAVKTVRAWLDVTPAGANNLVARLVDVSVLREARAYGFALVRGRRAA